MSGTLGLLEEPVALDEPVEVLPGVVVQHMTYALLVELARVALYEPLGWPGFAELLFVLELLTGGGVAAADAGARFEALEWVTKRGTPAYPNLVEGFPGVGCANSDNPEDYAAWAAAAAEADAGTGNYFGSPWTWLSSECALWPGEAPNRHTGPWEAGTAEPVLIVNPRFDPATPFHGGSHLPCRGPLGCREGGATSSSRPRGGRGAS